MINDHGFTANFIKYGSVDAKSWFTRHSFYFGGNIINANEFCKRTKYERLVNV